MDRLDYILNYKPLEGSLESFNLKKAYCFCLTAPESCRLLSIAVRTHFDLCEAALRKTCADLEISFDDCHRGLLNDLIFILTEGKAKDRQRAGYCLSKLATFVPPDQRRTIQEVFLTSRYITVRRRGYKSVTKDSATNAEFIRQVWESHGDPECAWLIVKTFPPDFLVENRRILASALLEGWQCARLYLNIAELYPDLLEELREIDEILYTYALAKMGSRLMSEEAIDLIKRNLGDDRFGLLVWSFGRMGLWDTLQHIERQLPVIQEAQLARYRSSTEF